jgi:hypothetical protein
MSKNPFIGAIVHYVKVEGHDMDNNPIRGCQAAIVTRMPDSYAKLDSVDLSTINGSTLDSEPHITHSADNEEMTWHWSEECLLSRKEGEEE